MERECLVEGSKLSDAQDVQDYAALSYLWGGRQKKTLLKANWDELHGSGSLSSAQNISRTIRHAIMLCAELGVPLLWVDALCIQQDGDVKAKMVQIGNMHHVYENAAFTIIAASGKDSEAGLSGVLGDHARQRRIKVQGLELLHSGKSLHEILDSTVWNQRCWTYQEYLLSPRRLIFSDEMIYFACGHGIFSEEGGQAHRRKDSSWQRLAGYDIDWKGPNWKTYSELASRYTSKSLTEPADVISAFTAIIEIMKRDCFPGTRFAWGIPDSGLDAALLWRRCLWCACGNSARGLGKRNEVFTANGKGQPPSWSWVGRQGHVQYSDWVLNHEKPNLSIIPRVNWVEGGIEWVKGKSDDESLPYLNIEADTANFLVTGRLFDFPSPPKESGDYRLGGDGLLMTMGHEIGHRFAIYDMRTGFHCGVVYDDHEIQELPGLYTSVKLSQTTLAKVRAILGSTTWIGHKFIAVRERIVPCKDTKGEATG